MNVIVDPPFRRVYLAVVMGKDIRNVELSTDSKRIRDNRFLFKIFSPSNSNLTLRDEVFKD
jgi:hypothetical protein